MGDHHDDVRAYARLAAQLATADTHRDELLAAHGLDDDGWDALEEEWMERLSEAEEGANGDGVPELLTAYAEAFAAAHAELAVLLPFERYLEITRALSRGRDLTQLPERFGVDLATYLSSHRHWTARMATDQELSEQLRRALR
ncbi:MAG TPA: hypothetical protein VFB62_08105 [Polyangiaceae bacterium]|nr:hypothetical protein [Polyangiaceae bacterium]